MRALLLMLLLCCGWEEVGLDAGRQVGRVTPTCLRRQLQQSSSMNLVMARLAGLPCLHARPRLPTFGALGGSQRARREEGIRQQVPLLGYAPAAAAGLPLLCSCQAQALRGTRPAHMLASQPADPHPALALIQCMHEPSQPCPGLSTPWLSPCLPFEWLASHAAEHAYVCLCLLIGLRVHDRACLV